MKVIEKENKEVNVLKDVICDCCGKSCGIFLDQAHTVTSFECMTLKANWGYGTKKDMERWTAQICEKCVDEKLVPLIKFKKEDLDFNSVIGTQSDYENRIEEGPYPGID